MIIAKTFCDFVICDFVILWFVNRINITWKVCKYEPMTHTIFAIRTYGKSEFALLMFPTIDDPKVADGFRGYGGAGVRWYENSLRAEDSAAE